MKKVFLLATALAALVSCSSDEFVGEQSPQRETGSNGAISFNGGAGVITRATTNSGDANVMLDNQFKVYGVKSGTTAGSDIQKVFVNYGVWFGTSTANTTTSNTRNWEYVQEKSADKGSSDNPMTVVNQTIKYWDHSAADYRFVAGSPFKAFTFNVNSTTNAIESATVTDLAGHVAANPGTIGSATLAQPIYIADPLLIPEANYSVAFGTAPVTFNFTRQQARVRVGIYETIPGYVIKEIHFYTNGSSTAETGSNLILTSGTTGYFTGATDGTATITYDWTTTPASYTFANGTGMTGAQNWYGGQYATSTDPTAPAIPAFTSTSAGLWGDNDKDMDANGYFTVIPTPSATTAAPLLIKCDYVLLSEKDGSGETITVTGATAAIPAAFSKWKPNTSYTYIFKISDNTNGKTNPNKPTVGLYPITFDAAVAAEANAEGTITTVSTPSITTYQTGSVTTTGIEYKTGTAIYLTVQNNTTGALNTLTDGGNAVGAVQVYKLAAAVDANPAPTEADMQITSPTGADLFTLGSEAATVDNISFEAAKHGSFTPSEAGYYVIQYLTTAAVTEPATPAVYTYKIIKVVAAGS